MGGKTSKITSQDRAILDLKNQRDRLKQYQKKIQAVIDKETELAKSALLKKEKRRALLALKKKKYQHQLLERTEAQLLTLEELTNSIEFSQVQKEVFEGLKKGNEILNELNAEMSIEKVEQLMDDTAEAIAYQNEIEEILSGKMEKEDEEEVLEELKAIEREQADRLFVEMPPVPATALPVANGMPSVPATVVHEIEEEPEGQREMELELVES